MDQKQFERLQTAVQWAVDEENMATPSLTLNMNVWGFGLVIPEKDPFEARFHANNPSTAIQVRAVCASACCLAGNIVLAAGDRFVIDGSYGPGEAVYADNCVDEKGVVHSIPVRALELIGLNDDEDMFGGSQHASDVVEKATMIAEENGFTLDIK